MLFEDRKMVAEKRKRERLKFKTKVILTAQPDVSIEAELTDISMSGLFIQTESQVPIETLVDLDISMTGRSSVLSIRINGNVVRSDESGIGIEFFDELEWLSVFAIYSRRDNLMLP
jgi:hypothetical protein